MKPESFPFKDFKTCGKGLLLCAAKMSVAAQVFCKAPQVTRVSGAPGGGPLGPQGVL